MTTQGFVRLNTVGTLRDLARFGVRLTDGDALIISDGELTATAVMRKQSEGWVAELVTEPQEHE
jgi:hypothetical protein